MTTDNGSSRSQSQTHADVRDDVVQTDADDLTDSFINGPNGNGGPVRWWTDFNFGTDVAAPIVRRQVEEEDDTKTSAETDKILAETGWVRTEESFSDTYGEGWVRKDDPQAPSGSQPAAVPPAGQQPDDGQAAADNTGKPVKPAALASFAADDPRPLYVYRQLLNAGELADWAAREGFTSTLPLDDMHVTVMYSKRPVNWFAMSDGFASDEVVVSPGGPRMVEALGTDGAVALVFQSTDLQWRHRAMRDAGASWDYPSYLPHVTITYDAGSVDLAAVKPYQGRLVFGPEQFEAISSGWQDALEETPTGASFAEPAAHGASAPDDADSIVDRMIAEDGYRVAEAMTGNLIERIMGATSEAEARALLATALGVMDEQPLMQALERAGFAAQLDAAAQPAPTETNN